MRVQGIHPATGQGVEIEIRHGVIQKVTKAHSPERQFISPGWFDLQVNGFAGVDYNNPASPQDEIARSIEVQRSTGVARFYPTVIHRFAHRHDRVAAQPCEGQANVGQRQFDARLPC